jgi:hypothetical protein
MEQVNCQYCGHDRQISEDTTCRCGTELLLTSTLREQLKSLEARIIALRLEQGKAISEICRRERLRNTRLGKGQTSHNFWHNVVGKPDWAGRTRTQSTSKIEINFAELD